MLHKLKQIFVKVQRYFNIEVPDIAIGRKILQVDYVSPDKVTRYRTDPGSTVYVLPVRGGVPNPYIEAQEVYFPWIDLAAAPTVKFTEDNIGRKMKEAKIRAINSLHRQENIEVFKLIECACKEKNTFATSEERFGSRHLDLAVYCLRKNGHSAGTICVSNHLVLFLKRQRNAIVWDAKKEKKTGVLGTFDGINIYASSEIPKNTVYVVAEPKKAGRIVIARDIRFVRADKPEKLRYGFIAYEQIAIGILDGTTCAKLLVDEDIHVPSTNIIAEVEKNKKSLI